MLYVSRLWRLFLLVSILLVEARAQAPTLTTINDTVYRADGAPAAGVLLISWPEFTTAGGQPVAAGTTSVTLGSGGSLSVALVPNQGATPATTVYTVVYQLTDIVKTEYWSVPAASPTNLATVRVTLGATGAVSQMVTQQYVEAAVSGKANDSSVVHLAGSETITGTKQFSAPPSLPTPVHAADGANKAYVDNAVQNVGGGGPYVSTAGGTMTGALTLSADPASPKQAADKHYVDSWAAVKADLISGLVPPAELGSGTPGAGTCLLGNQTWGACGSGTGSVSVSSTVVASPNLNATVPSAQSNFLNCTFRNSGSNVSLECPYGNSTSSFALGSQAVLNNQGNTYGAGLQDFSNASLKLPAGAGYAPAVSSAIGFDTTANMPVINISGTTQQLALTTSSISGQASTALALAATPAQCSGSFATGIQANGNANCSTADVVQLAETSQPGGISNYGLFWFDSATHTPRVIDNNGQVVQLGLMNVFNSDANTLEEYNGSNPQTFNVYGTRTDASDYERMRFGYDTTDGYFFLSAEANGSGTQRGLGFWMQGGLRWVIDESFDLKPWSDNVKDVGSPTLRPKHLYAGTYADLTGGALVTEIPNQSSTGTTLNKLAKVTGSPATAVLASTSDISGVIGIVTDGAGTSGSAQIARSGQATCVFDGPTTAGDYVQISTTVAGDCHDDGSSYPGTGQVVGRVLSTNGTAGTYDLLISDGQPAIQTKVWADVRDTVSPTPSAGGDFCAAINSLWSTTVQAVDATNATPWLSAGRLYCNSNPFAGAASLSTSIRLKLPCAEIVTSAGWNSPSGGAIDIDPCYASDGNDPNEKGSVIELCTNSAGCGPNTYPRFSTVALNAWADGDPHAPGLLCQSSGATWGSHFCKSGSTVSAGVTAAYATGSPNIVSSGSGAAWSSADIGGVLIDCDVTLSPECGYDSRIIAEGNCTGVNTPVTGCTATAGAQYLTATSNYNGSNNGSGKPYSVFQPNVLPAFIDSALSNTNSDSFGDRLGPVRFDLAGVPNSLAYFNPGNCQERCMVDSITVTQNETDQASGENGQPLACGSWDRSFRAVTGGGHWSMPHAVQCSAGNAGTTGSGAGWGWLVEEYSIARGNRDGGPEGFNLGTIVGGSSSNLLAGGFAIDGSSGGQEFACAHFESIGGDAVEVGVQNGVSNLNLNGCNGANTLGGDVVHFKTPAGSAYTANTNNQVNNASWSTSKPLVVDDTNSSTNVTGTGITRWDELGGTDYFGTVTAFGHLTMEGVTSTGATGTGNLVFSASPALTGTPTAPTPSVGDSSTKLATTAYVQNQTSGIPWLTVARAGSVSGVTFSTSSSQAKLWGVVLAFPLTTTQVTYYVGTADNTSNSYDIGIYNSSGTLVVHTGTKAGTNFAPTTGATTQSWAASATLQPGKYYLAITTNCTASCAALDGDNASAVTFLSGSAISVSAGGSLNGSLTPPSDSWSYSSTTPAWAVR